MTLCGLVGGRLGHSYSKIVHNLLTKKYSYELYPLPEDALESFLKTTPFRGLNVTLPYKKTVMPYCDALSDTAKKIGSVNTLVRETDGRLTGHNTDLDGFLYLSRSSGVSFSGKKVLILGSGGTSLTARTAAEALGAREILTVSRAGDVNYENILEHKESDILINTTPVGMFPDCGDLPVEPQKFPNLSGVLDAIYNPLKTRLVLEAELAGIPAAGGLSMLVAQAVCSSELFSGEAYPPGTTEEILRALFSSLCNIVLIGMPGSGKTKIGRRIAKELGRDFLDTDRLVEQKAGIKIPEYFDRYGEPAFRALETEAIFEAGKNASKVISTGGGSVLNFENYFPLAQNGRIYYLDRPLSRLAVKGRPLSSSPEALSALYKQREPFYSKFCHKKVPNLRSLKNVAQTITEDFYEAARP